MIQYEEAFNTSQDICENNCDRIQIVVIADKDRDKMDECCPQLESNIGIICTSWNVFIAEERWAGGSLRGGEIYAGGHLRRVSTFLQLYQNAVSLAINVF